MKWVRFSLHRKVLLTLLAVGLVPAAAGVALTAHELWTVIRDVSGDNLATEAQNIAGLLDREINAFINHASTVVAEQPGIAALFTETNASPVATSLTVLVPALWPDASTSRSLLLLPRSGPILPFLISQREVRLRPADPVAYRVLEAQFREARRLTIQPGLLAVSVHTDPILKRSAALAWIPVAPQEPALSPGWVCVEIPVDQLVRGDVSRALFEADEACVMTNVGHLLGAVRFRRGRAGQMHVQLAQYAPSGEERFEIHYADGTSQLIGFSPLPLPRALRRIGRSDSDWYMCIGRDLRPLTAGFRRQIARDLLGGVLLAIILSLVAYRLTRRLIRPIQQLEGGVRRVAGGDLTSRVVVQTGDELESLAHEFNEMADRLQKSANDIQQQMATVQKQAEELRLLHETTRAINARLDLDQTLTTFARETSRVISYDRLSVALLDEDGEHYTVQFVFPETEASDFSPGTRHRLDESYVGEAVRAGRPYVRQDVGKPPLRAEDEFLASAGFRAVMFIPLLSEAKAIGSVNLASRNPEAFGAEERERMTLLAESFAVAIQHRRLYMRVRRFAEDLEAEVRRRTAQLRVAQDKLVQTEKLAASGQLAAGIAHEINNPLGIIKNYLRLAMDRLRQLPPNEPASVAGQHLQTVEEEINRIARIVRNLLDLYHPREDSPVATNLDDLLERVLELFAPNWEKKNFRVVRRFAPSLPPLIVSGDRIRQVFINLLRNAEDAMDDGGTITLTTRLEPALVDGEDEHVVIEVEDTGCGIARGDLVRVFDPFYTTKKGGAGTGLGLSVSYGIVRSYGGTIDIDSEVGRGTRVTVRLPLIHTVTASPRKAEG
jgi:signal transduction histidine kinase